MHKPRSASAMQFIILTIQ